MLCTLRRGRGGVPWLGAAAAHALTTSGLSLARERAAGWMSMKEVLQRALDPAALPCLPAPQWGVINAQVSGAAAPGERG